jgi:hypothetical protein
MKEEKKVPRSVSEPVPKRIINYKLAGLVFDIVERLIGIYDITATFFKELKTCFWNILLSALALTND